MRKLVILFVVLVLAISMLGCPLEDLVGPMARPPADPAADTDLIQRALEVKNAPPTPTPVPTVYPGG